MHPHGIRIHRVIKNILYPKIYKNLYQTQHKLKNEI